MSRLLFTLVVLIPALASAQLVTDLAILDSQISGPDVPGVVVIGDPVQFIFTVLNNGPHDYDGDTDPRRGTSVTVDIDEPSKPWPPGIAQVECQYRETFTFPVDIPKDSTVVLPTPWVFFPICDSDSIRITTTVAVGNGHEDNRSDNDTLVTFSQVLRIERLINHDIVDLLVRPVGFR
jgi:hypothetical protein